MQPFFGQQIGCWKEFYGQPGTAEKVLSINFVPASYTPKGLFQRKSMHSVIVKTDGRPSFAGAVYSRWCLSVRKIGFETPSQGPLRTPTPVSCALRSSRVTWDVFTICESMCKKNGISRNNLFSWPKWSIDTGSFVNDKNGGTDHVTDG